MVNGLMQRSVLYMQNSVTAHLDLRYVKYEEKQNYRSSSGDMAGKRKWTDGRLTTYYLQSLVSSCEFDQSQPYVN